MQFSGYPKTYCTHFPGVERLVRAPGVLPQLHHLWLCPIPIPATLFVWGMGSDHSSVVVIVLAVVVPSGDRVWVVHMYRGDLSGGHGHEVLLRGPGIGEGRL